MCLVLGVCRPSATPPQPGLLEVASSQGRKDVQTRTRAERVLEETGGHTPHPAPPRLPQPGVLRGWFSPCTFLAPPSPPSSLFQSHFQCHFLWDPCWDPTVASSPYRVLEHPALSALILFVLNYVRPPWLVTAVAMLSCLPRISSKRVTLAASGAAHGFWGSQALS